MKRASGGAGKRGADDPGPVRLDAILGIAKVEEPERLRSRAGRLERGPLAPVRAVADPVEVLFRGLQVAEDDGVVQGLAGSRWEATDVAGSDVAEPSNRGPYGKKPTGLDREIEYIRTHPAWFRENFRDARYAGIPGPVPSPVEDGETPAFVLDCAALSR